MKLEYIISDSFIESFRSARKEAYDIDNSKYFADNRKIMGIYTVRKNKDIYILCILKIKEFILDLLMPRWFDYWYREYDIYDHKRKRNTLYMKHMYSLFYLIRNDTYFEQIMNNNLFFEHISNEKIEKAFHEIALIYIYKININNLKKETFESINNFINNLSLSNFLSIIYNI